MVDLSFLTGNWGGSGFEERWGPARAGTMLGTSRATEQDQTTHTEFMLLEDTPEGIVLKLVLPAQDKTMVFKLSRNSENEAEFVRQDAPERLCYRREGDRLHIQLDKASGGFKLELQRLREP